MPLTAFLTKFRRDKAQAVLYPKIMSGYLVCQIIYGAVHSNSIFTPPLARPLSGFQMVGLTETFVPICAHSASMLTLHKSWHIRPCELSCG